MTLGEKIQLSRKKKGMSQEDLANLLNVSRQAVQKWESGASTPELSKLVEMSNLFEVSIDWLVKDALEIKNETIKEAEAEPNKEERAAARILDRGTYKVIKVWIIIGMILTPLMFTGQFFLNNPNPSPFAFLGLLEYAITIPLGIVTIRKLKTAGLKGPLIGWGIVTMLFVSFLGGLLILCIKDNKFIPLGELSQNGKNDPITQEASPSDIDRVLKEEKAFKLQKHKERLAKTKIKPITKLSLIFRLSQIGILAMFVILVSCLGASFDSESNRVWIGASYGFVPLIIFSSLFIVDSIISRNFIKNPRFWIGCGLTLAFLVITISSYASPYGNSFQEGFWFIMFGSIFLSSTLLIYSLIEFIVYKDRSVLLLVERIVAAAVYVTVIMLLQMIPVQFNLAPLGIVQGHGFEVFLITGILIILYLLGSTLIKYFRFKEITEEK